MKCVNSIISFTCGCFDAAVDGQLGRQMVVVMEG